MTANANASSTTPSSSTKQRVVVPRNFGNGSPDNNNFTYDGSEAYYIFQKRGFFPVSRSVAIHLFVHPYEYMHDWMLYTLFYLPFGGVIMFLVAECAFVFWFDLCCQQCLVPYEQIGIYGKGKKLDERPLSSCLCLYNQCLETREIVLDDDDDDVNDADVEQPRV